MEKIQSLRDKFVRNLYRKLPEKKLDQLDFAASLNDLRSPPKNKLEALEGDRRGQYSIRINNQYRICFIWSDDGVEEIKVVDYH